MSQNWQKMDLFGISPLKYSFWNAFQDVKRQVYPIRINYVSCVDVIMYEVFLLLELFSKNVKMYEIREKKFLLDKYSCLF